MGYSRHEILCIDDDSEGLKVRTLLLEAMGYKVWSAPDARSGLNAFREHDVDAVVMDYEMPGMTGAQAAAEMKRLRPHVPVMILSALPWLPADAPKDAVDVFLQKGQPMKELAASIEAMIVSRARAERETIPQAIGGMVGSALGHVAHALRPRPKAVLH